MYPTTRTLLLLLSALLLACAYLPVDGRAALVLINGSMAALVLAASPFRKRRKYRD